MVGDSNVDFLSNAASEDVRVLIESFDVRNCHSLVTRPLSGKSIDNVFSNLPDKLKIDSIECHISDHNFIHCVIDCKHTLRDSIVKTKALCDYELLREHIRRDFQSLVLSGNPSSDLSNVISCISNAISNSTKVTKRRELIKNCIAPWVNLNIQSLIKFKRKLLKQRRQNPNVYSDDSLRRIGKVIKRATRENMNNYYYDNLSKFEKDARKCWQFLNQSLGRNKRQDITLRDSQGRDITEDSIKAEEFNNYFLNSVEVLKSQISALPGDSWNSFRSIRHHSNTFQLYETTENEVREFILQLDRNKSPGHDSITPNVLVECCDELLPYLVEIFNSSVRSHVYPQVLKVQKILPIPKEKNKIFERIIYKQLSEYLLQEELLSNNQYGFRKGCGTDEAVVNVVNYICSCFDEGYSTVGGMFYDFSKAFDLVDHGILLEKLSFYGIRGRELAFFRSYLRDRVQYVQINNGRSSMGIIKHGVPQGSVLGPLLFKIYIDDLNNLNLRGRIYMYADDLCIFYPSKIDSVLLDNIQHDANIVSEFAKLNKLKLNLNKTQLMRFRPHQSQSSDNIIMLEGNEIREVKILTYVYKVLHNIGFHTIRFRQSNHGINTRNHMNLYVVRCRLEMSKQRIEFMGSMEYNDLPLYVKDAQSISIFKQRLKRHLIDNIEMLII
ncbi:uncharacterized protein LOC142239575 [Haematobia irritans]|uniref:uncharacterized protein LOC142239575 n=1 Tax=Haematobia irritans TaxID=7368 RepID=UPI003F4FA034